MADANPIPREFRFILATLGRDVRALNVLWDHTHRTLFLDNDAIDTLNDAAGPVFQGIEYAIRFTVLLGTARLYDRAQSGDGHRNLTLAGMAEAAWPFAPFKAVEYNDMLEALEEKVEPLRKMRNKELAHLDLKTAMRLVPTAEVHKDLVGELIDAAGVLVRKAYVELVGKDFQPKPNVVDGDGSAHDLLRILGFGNEHQQRLWDQENDLRNRSG